MDNHGMCTEWVDDAGPNGHLNATCGTQIAPSSKLLGG
jgi:hypothetical protein